MAGIWESVSDKIHDSKYFLGSLHEVLVTIMKECYPGRQWNDRLTKTELVDMILGNKAHEVFRKVLEVMERIVKRIEQEAQQKRFMVKFRSGW